MRRFADLHLQPDLSDMQETERVFCKASDLGYGLVGVSLPEEIHYETIGRLREMCSNYGVDLATRIDIAPESQKDLLSGLRRLRRRFELLSVVCLSKSVARQAAKDHRVDLLAFPKSHPRERYFDYAEARLASQGVAALEIDMSLILESAGSHRSSLISSLRNEKAIADKLGIPVVISSNATTSYHMRGPHDLASLATLFGVNKSSALEALSWTPLTIVKRNREKLNPNYVARGIRIVQREKSETT